ncbi:MAG: sigma-54-dependent Fis family transcriptional regulator [Saprospiraceae bacterium]|nr:sigma-54-dependent Fis family transcriptional regulator [Saprospiraceae bacterium]
MRMKQAGTILIVDDEEDILFSLRMFLKQHFERVFTEENPQHLPRLLKQYEPDVVLLDMNFRKGDTSGEEGLQWLQKTVELRPGVQVIMITAYGEVEKAVRALKTGAADFVEKPWRNEKLLATVHAAFNLSRSRQEVHQLQTRQRALTEQLGQGGAGDIVGQSPAVIDVFKTIDKVAATDANILILGENGTGKELVARAIHRASPRRDQAFINVDLGAIPESLFESELFGHKKGAFTDAREDRAGRFEAAEGGTLFLDEIGNLSLPMQAKLLAALQNREIIRIGSNKAIPVDIRLICATNMPLYEMVREKTFRQDLLYRINTVELNLPSLRAREGDVALLAEHFLRQYAKKYQKGELELHPSARQKLEQYPWPGNIRELRHAIERAVILSEKTILTPGDFLLHPDFHQSPDFRTDETLNLEEMEKKLIQRAMTKHQGNISKAADELGLTRAALYRRLEKHGL